MSRSESASFAPPTKEDLGDFASGRLLRDAARLSTRAAAGPFRSFARINVEPRPYQLVPLMMALRLDPVRLLIADDVGIGKTIEAGLIARELLDRGEIHRMAVLCPPHLAEQWQRELAEKFHIEAELILSSTIQRLERNMAIGVSVFDRHRFTIVSTDFIKGDRRAADFANRCPEFVIVDEAHGCTLSGGVGRGQQQRFELMQKISAEARPPHRAGHRDAAFVAMKARSDPCSACSTQTSLTCPRRSSAIRRESIRRKLARHLVQRRRDDIRDYLATDTKFPARIDREVTYAFSPEYKGLFDDIVSFAHELVSAGDGDSALDACGTGPRWRCCDASRPARRPRSPRCSSRSGVDLQADSDLDEYGRRTVLDIDDLDSAFEVDLCPGAETDQETGEDTPAHARVRQARPGHGGQGRREAPGRGPGDRSLINEGFRPDRVLPIHGHG